MEKWKRNTPEKIKILEDALIRFPCDRRMMFGSPVFLINRNMFAGVHQDNIFIRLSEADRKAILAGAPGATQFEPMKGRFMKEYITLPESVHSNSDTFNRWLKRSHAYASTLPPKTAKKRKD